MVVNKNKPNRAIRIYLSNDAFVSGGIRLESKTKKEITQTRTETTYS